MIPFTAEVLFSLYGRYNMAIGPLLAIGFALCLLALFMALRPFAGSGRAISAILAAFWIWIGAIFHFGYMAPLNWGAWIFGAFFIVQGLLLAWLGGARGRLSFHGEPGLRGTVGVILFAFALAYPAMDLLLGHRWPQLQFAGTLPAPTVAVTFALLLMTRGRDAIALAIIPLAWALIDGAAAFFLGIWPDVAMAAGAVVAFALLLVGRQTSQLSPQPG
jgi:hypothetical protein